MLFAELHTSKTLPRLMHACEARTINNSTKWGPGRYAYGSLLRLGHAADSVKHWCVPEFAKTKFLPWKDQPSDHGLESTAAMGYFHITARQPAPEDASLVQFPPVAARFGPTQHARLRVQFVRFIFGQTGPFAKQGIMKKADESARMCNKLWPLGPPCRHDLWYAMEGFAREDYAMTIDAIFPRTVPIPVASRWYDSFPARALILIFLTILVKLGSPS